MIAPDETPATRSATDPADPQSTLDHEADNFEQQAFAPVTAKSLSFNEVYAARRLPDASLLLMQDSKPLRKSVHALVHGFRHLHGVDASGLMQNAEYDKILNTYSALEHTVTSEKVTEALARCATPERYAEVRQAGRMRKSAQDLPESQLRFLAHEIRAAIIWRATFGSD